MAVDTSKFTQNDKNEVEEVKEALRRVMKAEISDDFLEMEGIDGKKKIQITENREEQKKEELKTLKSFEKEASDAEGLSKKQESPEEILEKQLEDVKENELKEFNISSIKDYESGYDLGKLEDLKELISKRKVEGKSVADLEEILRKMLAEMDREKELNESGKDKTEDQHERSVNLSNSYVDGEEGSFEEIRKELMLLTGFLLTKGVLKICEMASKITNSGDDDHDSSLIYMIDDNISEEDSEHINRLQKLESLYFKKMKENGLTVFTKEHDSDDSRTFNSHHYLLSNNYTGEKDIYKMSDEDIARNIEELQNNPKQFIIISTAHCKNKEEMDEVVNVSKLVKSTVLDTILEFTQLKLDGAGFIDKFEKEESSYKKNGLNTQRVHDQEHGGKSRGR